ncbi:MAG: DNA polymerase IV [Ornithinimicrobium sp.]
MTRHEANIVHVDLDAFFAAVEQRDKPSLRGKPVVVGGTGSRGVVATASYEARVFGARSAMPTQEARRRCPPGTAFLGGRHGAYRVSSDVVMAVLRDVSPILERVSVDEAFLDLIGADEELRGQDRHQLGTLVQEQIKEATGGLTASVGIASNKMMAKIASELGKPAGVFVVQPGTEVEVLQPMSVRAISGVGPATATTLRGFGVETVADLARVSITDLVSIFGASHGEALHHLAQAQDDREVTPQRTAKSISNEETFASDIADPAILGSELDALCRRVSQRLEQSEGFARTITIKARWHDFRTVTRSGSLPFATGDAGVISREARRLLRSIEIAGGLRLLGVGVSGLTSHAQEELDLLQVEDAGTARAAGLEYPDAFAVTGAVTPEMLEPQKFEPEVREPERSANDQSLTAPTRDSSPPLWSTGSDVAHDEHGMGWVWGSGSGVVTVRFEGPRTSTGRVRTFTADDPALRSADPPDWRPHADGAC